MARTPALMLQGTGSNVGNSLLVAGLARAFGRRGLRVRPFKPQNMSNNAAVTADGGEIGRAQALQARACGVPPSVHMNPVLLKPQSETGAQVVVQGRVLTACGAWEYLRLKPRLLPYVLESFARLGAEADFVLVEGAGSPAEVNLRAGDIVVQAARGYSLFSARTGGPVARLRATGGTDQVQALWCTGERWRASGPFGIAALPLDQALDSSAAEPAFSSHA